MHHQVLQVMGVRDQHQRFLVLLLHMLAAVVVGQVVQELLQAMVVQVVAAQVLQILQ
jgi:hypothetical protein